MKQTVPWTGVILVAVVLVLIGGYLHISTDAERLPENRPEVFLAQPAAKPGARVVVCAGDSLTHGAVSVNYVELLGRTFRDGGYEFVNAGVNSSLAYNLNRRLEDIIRCDPDYVTILIGSNDANASLGDPTARRLIRKMKLPRRPDRAWFRSNLVAVCEELKARTHARIALLSLPPIGEDVDSVAFRRAAEYSGIIKEVARSQNVDYLPLNEAMTAGIRARGQKPTLSHTGDTQLPLYAALAKHYLLRQSYDDISAGNGFLYLTDLLHLNTRGATLVAGFIGEFITRK
ncbi:MAG: SGNH/GDSL hydrolase family protein [Syntrophales bacterium]|nr:SGNH/GDSL hydrolase family protein [Syntrophales bacterium]HOG06509.1 SGNH/GDSL hydrolase family protein [Syntrophales bacterium]HPB69968.1 SGNH/GDSL hydrolase family protein [Syntrophales bacterium]HQN25122.1 SGNH/GDSL hydrolase family protein [Syntrophales bacterium]HQP29224.1 SGNH/GDSL hydrolase family protein [Syntrophales bacterium]